jgi:thymidylate synthase
MAHMEHQYLDLIRRVLNGSKRMTRNGVVHSVFGAHMRYSLENDTIPLITTKKIAWRTCLKELLWFISGDTNNDTLKKQNVHIWDANGTRSFLDNRGLFHYHEDDLGPIYGHQWRRFGAAYVPLHRRHYQYEGVDQLANLMKSLKDDPYSRRHVVSAWNPSQLHQMALPPCHILFQMWVDDNKLSCSLYQRSGDVGLGVPFNIASYSFLTHMIAKTLNYTPHEFIHTIGDAHIYEEHKSVLEKQLERTPYEFPKINVVKKPSIFEYSINDIQISGYTYHTELRMPMKA